jgi:para-aminobenzoate synthetase
MKPRGLYSGVLGYLDVGGGGDFSVVIRTAFRYGDGGGGGGLDWQIGAGGAVTVLSEAEAEWEEMLAKRESLLKVFGGLDEA